VKRSSNWLTAYVFLAALCASVWVDSTPPLAWLIAAAIVGALWRWPFELDESPPAARAGLRDLGLALAVAAPAFVYLIATWRQEFPTSGDQFLHNGYALEAFAFWWPWPFAAALAAMAATILALRRNPRSPLPLIGFVILAGLSLCAFRGGFAGRYPALLHFFSIPFRFLIPAPTPIAVERLVNVLSIPIWLMILRPKFLGRGVDLSAILGGTLLFWQKDVIYYVTSGYLEAWAIVLLLTAGEHLVRFGRQAIWRPLLLLGTAALIKDQAIITLPLVVLAFFPKQERLRYLATVAAAVTPFALYAVHPMANVWRGSSYVSVAQAFGSHAVQWGERVALQFGAALPVAAVAVGALLVLALRNRGAAVLLAAAALDATIFFFAAAQQHWPGYPRTNLIPLAYAALALGVLVERRRTVGVAAVVLTAALNAVPLASFMTSAFGPSDGRNFFEHKDSPIFYPIAEVLAKQTLVAPDQTIEILNNGKRVWSFYYPGLFVEEYPALSARYRVRVGSFRDMPQRCACSGDVAKLAVFVRFTNLGATLPARTALEKEGAACRAAMEASCLRRTVVTHDGSPVAMLGVAR
jgi:hypothetical protein